MIETFNLRHPRKESKTFNLRQSRKEIETFNLIVVDFYNPN